MIGGGKSPPEADPPLAEKTIEIHGGEINAGGESRTLMTFRSRDFESRVSTIPPLRRG